MLLLTRNSWSVWIHTTCVRFRSAVSPFLSLECGVRHLIFSLTCGAKLYCMITILLHHNTLFGLTPIVEMQLAYLICTDTDSLRSTSTHTMHAETTMKIGVHLWTTNGAAVVFIVQRHGQLLCCDIQPACWCCAHTALKNYPPESYTPQSRGHVTDNTSQLRNLLSYNDNTLHVWLRPWEEHICQIWLESAR